MYKVNFRPNHDIEHTFKDAEGYRYSKAEIIYKGIPKAIILYGIAVPMFLLGVILGLTIIGILPGLFIIFMSMAIASIGFRPTVNVDCPHCNNTDKCASFEDKSFVCRKCKRSFYVNWTNAKEKAQSA